MASDKEVLTEPDAYLYIVHKFKKSKWVRAGIAYKHKDGLGYKIMLSAYPAADHHLVMRNDEYIDGENCG